jgi:hypothetical protein
MNPRRMARLKFLKQEDWDEDDSCGLNLSAFYIKAAEECRARIANQDWIPWDGPFARNFSFDMDRLPAGAAASDSTFRDLKNLTVNLQTILLIDIYLSVDRGNAKRDDLVLSRLARDDGENIKGSCV